MNQEKISNSSLKLFYQDVVGDQNVNIKELRPKGSYDNLIAKRTHSLKPFLNSLGSVGEKYLLPRLCPSCSSKEHEFQFTKDHFNVVCCKKCSLVYVNPILKPEVYNEIYRSSDYIDIVKKLGEASHEYRKKRFGQERVDNIESFSSPGLPKRLLEIGCSTGFTIEVAKERGWDVTGVELNPSAVKFAKERGLKVHNKPIEEIDFEEEKFSCIAMYDVIEHLVYPGGLIRKVKELLVEGGTIYVYVPNYQSASRYLLGVENSHFIWPTHHLVYFTPYSLRNFLNKNGFKVLHWETQGLDLDDWLWYLKEKTNYDTNLIENHKVFLQFAINSGGYGKNLRMYARGIFDA